MPLSEEETIAEFDEQIRKMFSQGAVGLAHSMEGHNSAVCDKLHALDCIALAIHNLVGVAAQHHHGRGIFVDRILDFVLSMEADARELIIEIRMDVQEELS
jgi:hypothetical protein